MKKIEERIRLEESIPLTTPFAILIEPTNLCNFTCKFCPTGNSELLKSVSRPRGVMDYNLFVKVINDIKMLDKKLKKLYFYKDGEPLLNKDLVRMIKYAKDNDVALDYRLTTNGSLFNKKLNLLLIESGLTNITISIYAVSGQGYRNLCKTNIDYEKMVENITHLYKNRRQCYINVKIIDVGLPNYEKQKFMNDFGNISDSIHIDNLMGWSLSSLKDFTLGRNSTSSPDGRDLVIKNVCPLPFYSLSVNYNGTVSICCVDWSHFTVIGDLKREHLLDIWNGNKLFEFRRMHLLEERHNNRACKDCQYRSTLPDNIDDYARDILKRL